jgi:predicted transglutaminase-like cysteine proteinase
MAADTRSPPILRAVLIAAAALHFSSPAHARLGPYSFETDDDWLIPAEAFPAWAELARRHAAESSLIAACLEDERRCPRHLRGYREIIVRLGERPRWDQVKRLDTVNRFINRRRWVSDRDVDAPGGWRTLNDFLLSGGDCEDYAIAKYFMLRQLGFSAAELRIVFAYDRVVNDYHAVLAVKMDDRVLLMEIDDTLLTGAAQREYRFLFSINEIAVWDHMPETAAEEVRNRTVRRSSR